MPYNAIAIKPPAPLGDASFDAFRKQLAGIAQKKDRAALARLIAASFFWIPGDKDVADKSKPAIANLAKAIGLEGKNAFGWGLLADYAGEPTGAPDPQRQGVICSPAQPSFDQNAAAALLKATQTGPMDWLYPVRDGVEVRSGPQQRAAVSEKLGTQSGARSRGRSAGRRSPARFLEGEHPIRQDWLRAGGRSPRSVRTANVLHQGCRWLENRRLSRRRSRPGHQLSEPRN